MNEIPPLQLLFIYLGSSKQSRAQRDADITELWNLVASMGKSEVIELFEQKGYPSESTYIGPGKAQEVAEFLKTQYIDVIIVYGTLSPLQKFNLTKMYWGINSRIQVWDRVDLILAIFSKHAHTKEALLQIELARMHHMGPRIYGMGMILSRQGAGIGTRGIGETNTERMKRHWRREIKKITDSIDSLVESKYRQIANRKKQGLPTVSLVGYTNAGKTTLFNLLTHKQNFVDNLLFATLDSTVGKVYIQELQKNIVVSDTIGFIKNLPPELIDAFRSTLLESMHADVILHVVDVSDPEMSEKIDVVDIILEQLQIPEEKILLVFNKTDKNPAFDKESLTQKYSQYPMIFLSAKANQNVDILLSSISKALQGTR